MIVFCSWPILLICPPLRLIELPFESVFDLHCKFCSLIVQKNEGIIE